MIQRCQECNSCPIEMMLTDDQKEESVLNNPLPEHHIHREIIEQICGRYYDSPCKMKYLIMRLSCNDRVAVQNAIIGIFLWDLGKKYQRAVEFPEGAKKWNETNNLGRELEESYAKRFSDLWALGLRGNRQSISVINLYETIIGTPGTYNKGLKHYQNLREEHLARDKCILKI
jgi:hypothetical protein